jgi:hypothetical protein
MLVRVALESHGIIEREAATAFARQSREVALDLDSKCNPLEPLHEEVELEDLEIVPCPS